MNAVQNLIISICIRPVKLVEKYCLYQSGNAFSECALRCNDMQQEFARSTCLEHCDYFKIVADSNCRDIFMEGSKVCIEMIRGIDPILAVSVVACIALAYYYFPRIQGANLLV